MSAAGGWVMRSQSGRRWHLGATDSTGRQITEAEAEQIAAELGFALAAPCCRCCEAADERGKLDHELHAGCPHPACDFCKINPTPVGAGATP